MADRDSFVFLLRQFFEKDPLAAARALETIPEEQAVSILQALPDSLAGAVFAHLEIHFAANVLKNLPSDRFETVVQNLDPQYKATLLMLLSASQREQLLKQMPPKAKQEIQSLLTYPENSAGRVMTPHFLAFHKDINVTSAIERIRFLAKQKAPASYAYVVDEKNRLIGVINMHDLMLAAGNAPLESIMRRDVFSVNGFMDREQVAAEFSKRRYFAVPVVDNENRLIGVVKAESLINDVQEEATEDIQKMFGAGGDERAFSPLRFSLAKRLPWLHVNLATAFLAGSVVGAFSDVIGKFPVLAVYLPVVAGQGGNAGSQSLVVVIRGLVMREIPASKVWKLIFKEAGIGVVNGVIIGAVTALAAWLWHGNPFLGVIVGLAMLFNLLVAGFTGAAIPLTMKAIGLDPAQCSNIILTTFTDVMGFFALLGFAVLFSQYLM